MLVSLRQRYCCYLAAWNQQTEDLLGMSTLQDVSFHSCFEQSYSFFIFSGKQKYFATPNELRKIKDNENLRGSTRKPAFEIVSSREKSVGVTDLFLEETSTGKMAVRGVTLRELGRPLTRSKDLFFSTTLNSYAVIVEEVYVGIATVELTDFFFSYLFIFFYLRLQEPFPANGFITKW
jgi:hypothetical protein